MIVTFDFPVGRLKVGVQDADGGARAGEGEGAGVNEDEDGYEDVDVEHDQRPLKVELEKAVRCLQCSVAAAHGIRSSSCETKLADAVVHLST